MQSHRDPFDGMNDSFFSAEAFHSGMSQGEEINREDQDMDTSRLWQERRQARKQEQMKSLPLRAFRIKH